MCPRCKVLNHTFSPFLPPSLAFCLFVSVLSFSLSHTHTHTRSFSLSLVLAVSLSLSNLFSLSCSLSLSLPVLAPPHSPFCSLSQFFF